MCSEQGTSISAQVTNASLRRGLTVKLYAVSSALMLASTELLMVFAVASTVGKPLQSAQVLCAHECSTIGGKEERTSERVVTGEEGDGEALDQHDLSFA